MKRRSFDGCWTCRSRKVRCDLQRPTCARCAKAGLKCGGFAIRLVWSTPLTVGHNHSLVAAADAAVDTADERDVHRRKITPVRFPRHLSFTTFKQVDLAVNAVEAWVSRGFSAGPPPGPFAAFVVHPQPPMQPTRHTAQPAAVQPVLLVQPAPTALSLTAWRAMATGVFSSSNNSWVHPELLESAKLTILAIKGTAYNFGEQNMLHILYPKFFPNTDSDDSLANPRVLQRLIKVQNGTLVVFPLFNRLLHCFQKNVRRFMRIYYAHNYWEKVITPFVYKVFGEFLCLDSTELMGPGESKVSQVKAGIAYAVLALAAFQQRREDDTFLNLSIELRKMAITILNRHLDEYGDELPEEGEPAAPLAGGDREYEELLLLGIVLQFQIDNYYSVFENFDYLYGIGEYIIKECFSDAQSRGNNLVLTQYLIALVEYHHVFYISTQSINSFNYSASEAELQQLYQSSDDSDEEEHEPQLFKPTIANLVSSDTLSFCVKLAADGSIGLSNSSSKRRRPVAPSSAPLTPQPSELQFNQFSMQSLHLLFGIPGSLLFLFRFIVELTNHKKLFHQRKHFPRSYYKVCAETERELMSWNVAHSWILVDNHNQFLLDFHRALYHNVQAFHHALVVYFHQLIKQLHRTNYQSHIVRALEHLVRLVELPRAQPSFWPILVCAGDALEHEVRTQFELLWLHDAFAQKANNWRAKQVIYEVWKRRDVGEDANWMDIVREWEIVMSLA